MELVKGNPGEIFCGFCIKNKEGDLLYAESKSIGIATNMEAEAQAIWKAISYCADKGSLRVILQADSLTIKHMLAEEWKVPWELIEIVGTSQQLIQQFEVKLTHVYREANMLADFIINGAFYKKINSNIIVFCSYQAWGEGYLIQINTKFLPSE